MKLKVIVDSKKHGRIFVGSFDELLEKLKR